MTHCRRPVRVCLVLPAHWEAIMGGSQYQAKLLVEHLARHGGFEVYYIAQKTRAGFQPMDHTVVALPGTPRIRRLAQFYNTPGLWKALKRIQPDVIYQRVASAYTGICALYARRHGSRLVWHIASDGDVEPLDPTLSLSPATWHLHVQQRMCEYGIRHADCIIAQTRQQATLLTRNYKRTADAVIPNYHPPPEGSIDKTGRLRVLWIANMKRLKQPAMFCRLARDLAHLDGVDFVMIGAQSNDVPLRQDMDREMAETPNLTYLGMLPQHEVNEQLARSHLLVNTSTVEGFSNTFVQAWMREVPVISLTVNPDGAFDGNRLGMCAQGDYDTLLQLTSELLRDRPRLLGMGRECRDHSMTIHSMDNVERLRDHISRAAGADFPPVRDAATPSQ